MARPVHSARPSGPVSRRLGMYFFGIAIGLVLVGLLLSVRRLMVEPAHDPAGGTPPGARP